MSFQTTPAFAAESTPAFVGGTSVPTPSTGEELSGLKSLPQVADAPASRRFVLDLRLPLRHAGIRRAIVAD
mgnify:CR=1 FL=1